MEEDGFALNSIRDDDGSIIPENVDDCTIVDYFDPSRVQLRDQREGLHLLSGGDLGVATEQFRFLNLRGTAKAPNDDYETLEDRKSELFRWFDIEEAQLDAPDMRGLGVLDFWSPTNVPPAGHQSPVHEMFYCRPASFPVLFDRRGSGMSFSYGMEFVCEDPRRYMFDETVVTFNATDGWSQNLPNWTTTMGAQVFPIITVVTSGNGANNLTINNGEAALVFDLSTAGAVNFEFDGFSGTVTKQNGDRKDTWRTSGAMTVPFGIPAGGCTYSIGNRTNLTSVTVSYRQGRR